MKLTRRNLLSDDLKHKNVYSIRKYVFIIYTSGGSIEKINASSYTLDIVVQLVSSGISIKIFTKYFVSFKYGIKGRAVT